MPKRLTRAERDKLRTNWNKLFPTRDDREAFIWRLLDDLDKADAREAVLCDEVMQMNHAYVQTECLRQKKFCTPCEIAADPADAARELQEKAEKWDALWKLVNDAHEAGGEPACVTGFDGTKLYVISRQEYEARALDDWTPVESLIKKLREQIDLIKPTTRNVGGHWCFMPEVRATGKHDRCLDWKGEDDDTRTDLHR